MYARLERPSPSWRFDHRDRGIGPGVHRLTILVEHNATVMKNCVHTRCPGVLGLVAFILVEARGAGRMFTCCTGR